MKFAFGPAIFPEASAKTLHMHMKGVQTKVMDGSPHLCVASTN